jgi:3D (Asp-Asp-Asp) domain-containing protein
MRNSGVMGLGLSVLLALSSVGCVASDSSVSLDDEAWEGEFAEGDTASSDLSVLSRFTTTGTGYYPDSSTLEGGFLDRKGKPLKTLQQFLAGNASYVSVAMDTKAFSYGQRLRLKQFNERYGREIVFRVVDTGSAFRGKGRSRIDICVANRTASLDRTVNSVLSAEVVDESSTAPAPTTGGSSGSPASTCSNDGACNPGSNGSGKICVSGRCVAGCRSDAQCPGSSQCVSGQCR